MTKKIIQTDNAPQAIGPYSQAVEVNGLLFLSGQIPLNPQTNELVGDGFLQQAQQVFANLDAVAKAAGCSLLDAVKLTIYVTDLDNFAIVNEVMAKFLPQPYPARAAVQVAALPKGALLEVDAILVKT